MGVLQNLSRPEVSEPRSCDVDMGKGDMITCVLSTTHTNHFIERKRPFATIGHVINYHKTCSWSSMTSRNEKNMFQLTV